MRRRGGLGKPWLFGRDGGRVSPVNPGHRGRFEADRVAQAAGERASLRGRVGQAWTQGSSASCRRAGEAREDLCDSVTCLLLGGKVVPVGGGEVTGRRTLGRRAILVLFLELVTGRLDTGADAAGEAVRRLAL